ncbi:MULTISPECIES: WD40 repeat domain-containing protein [unclassified Rhizobium]|uniref:WD40 repeat domain-containing protein n=1 Tax=unclassified Rhizobium TaxID=2613769 RepID=UPI0007E94608|nr:MULTISPECIES: WD40 repeat domain-containing protein [unclassified Rhizobium]ANM12305.1 WD40/YVTN repeat-like domain-containing protein [Rhizobium sp. N324]ANM18708.1 WD40/YVTN repeat-like domain-containing protein [Rhizobium sp. N541]ANM25094.1 WD40/YVTN repeat-like domain-containing protein [Rhizobium sp. N941]OYD05839.1 WD40/YVTN repeat-like domain-containing protein [Rhizobium sp. N4311]
MPAVAPLDLDGHVLAVEFLGDVPFFASANGTFHRLDGGDRVCEAHQGMLTAIRDPYSESLISGGEDGKVLRITADGSVSELATAPRKWISQVAAGPQGAIAYSYGKSSLVRLADGTTKEFAEERTVEGLAFAPKGLRIAAARYNGVSLHWIGMTAKPVDLEWKGAHTGVTFSPDGNFLVTSMQENALHGWKLDSKPGSEARHMRMTGYPAKVKSLSWSIKGKWLASSGAPAAIVWPFQGKDGPMGKAPLELGTRANIMATAVKFHPLEDILAIGFIDGMILAVRIADSKEALLRRPGKGAITAMSWSKNGKLLAFASEAGDCGVIDISA